jgi:hypothetical protein
MSTLAIPQTSTTTWNTPIYKEGDENLVTVRFRHLPDPYSDFKVESVS